MYIPGNQDVYRQKRREGKTTILRMLRDYQDDFDRAIRRCFDRKRSAYYN